jgi:alanyl-tRNA synthetase
MLSVTPSRTTQSPDSNDTDVQKEIEQHEKELKNLLNRVLKQPLDSAFEKFGSRLDALEDQVKQLSEVGFPALQQDSGDIKTASNRHFRKFDSFEEKSSNELKTMREQLMPNGQSLSDLLVDKLTDTLGIRMEGVESKLAQIEANRLTLGQTQAAWQKNQEDRQHELQKLQEHVSIRLAIVGKSLRAMQITILVFVVVSAVGVLVIAARPFL